MYLQRIFSAIAIGILSFTAYPAFSASAQTLDKYESQEIDEVECYRHVLEASDTLCLVRYTLVDDDDVLSISGAFLQLENATSTLATIFAPVEDYGIAAFYFDDDDPNIPVWDDSNVQALFKPNPFIAPTGVASDALSVGWANTTTSGGTFQETLDELLVDVPRVVVRLQDDDPQWEEGDLTNGVGLTPIGKFYVVTAFPILGTLLNPIYNLESQFAGEDHDPGTTPQILTDLETAGKSSYFSEDWAAMWASFGLNFNGAMILFAMILMIAMVLIVKKLNGNQKTVFTFGWPILLAVSYAGGFPFEGTVLIAIAVFIGGMGLFIRRFIPVGG